jgi:hypothetical protein
MGFATLVAHVCARLIDRVSVTIDPAETDPGLMPFEMSVMES